MYIASKSADDTKQHGNVDFEEDFSEAACIINRLCMGKNIACEYNVKNRDHGIRFFLK